MGVQGARAKVGPPRVTVFARGAGLFAPAMGV